MKDTVDMARKAGFRVGPSRDGPDDVWGVVANLKRFEAFIRVDERERLAKMIEDAPPLMPFAQNDQGGCLMCGFTPKLAAKTIRARGNT